ncbi:MAG: hypothetical protein U9O49_01750 [Candidatus Thermoplasmatota archaeon]|nr:hypothetical protein [Candidatus Thermoplasmatota archaeon]
MSEDDMMKENMEPASSMKGKLQKVSDEIDSIKNSFSKGTEDLARIQSMLDVESVEDMSGIIKRFEGQVAEAERKRTEAAEEAKKHSEELEKEKERLIKLWDAYKNQEEELSTTEKRVLDYEGKIRTAEVSKKQLEDDLTARINTLTQKMQENENKINQVDEYRQKYEESDEIINNLEGEIKTLKDQIYQKNDETEALQKQVNDMKENEKYAEYKEKYEQVTTEYEKEKERLTKLYHLYEETETENKKLKEETTGWQEWFESNKGIFDKLFAAPPTTDAPSVKTTPTPSEKKPKKKRKLKLRK